MFQSTKSVEKLERKPKIFENRKVWDFLFFFGVSLRSFHLEKCNKFFGKNYRTINFFLVNPLKHSYRRSLSKLLEKMHEHFEKWKILGFLGFLVLIWDIFTEKTAMNSSEKPTGQHNFSLLPLFNVPIHKSVKRFGEKLHIIFESWELFGFS